MNLLNREIKHLLIKGIMNFFAGEEERNGKYGISIAMDIKGHNKSDVENEFKDVVEEINEALEDFFLIKPVSNYLNEDYNIITFIMEVEGRSISLKDCKWCNGSGIDYQHYPCPDCQGSGYESGLYAVELNDIIASLYG